MAGNDRAPGGEPGAQKISRCDDLITVSIANAGDDLQRYAAILALLRDAATLATGRNWLGRRAANQHILHAVCDHPQSPHVVDMLAAVLNDLRESTA